MAGLNLATALSAIISPLWSVGRSMKVASGTTAAITGFKPGATATVNSPTEDRAHAAVANTAAPMYDSDPTSSKVRPKSPLWAVARLFGMSPAADLAEIAFVAMCFVKRCGTPTSSR